MSATQYIVYGGLYGGLFEALLALADVDLVARVALCRRPLVLAAKRGGRGRERARELNWLAEARSSPEGGSWM